MSNFSTGLTVAAVGFAFILAGCETPAPPPPPPAPPPAVTRAAPPPPAPTVEPGSLQDYQATVGVGVGDTVHFEYNEFAVRDEDKAVLKKQADWLSKFPDVKITIEGYADERGTREYNIALGGRRANAVKEYLVSVGISTARIDTISYGKDKPICADSTEECWQQNRRGVTAIKAK